MEVKHFKRVFKKILSQVPKKISIEQNFRIIFIQRIKGICGE